jgi:hypothetical protein
MTNAMISIVWMTGLLSLAPITVWAITTVQAKTRNREWGKDV